MSAIQWVDERTTESRSFLEIISITQADGSRLGDVLYSLILAGLVVVENGIIKEVPR